jgi:hypothetical protein
MGEVYRATDGNLKRRDFRGCTLDMDNHEHRLNVVKNFAVRSLELIRTPGAER